MLVVDLLNSDQTFRGNAGRLSVFVCPRLVLRGAPNSNVPTVSDNNLPVRKKHALNSNSLVNQIAMSDFFPPTRSASHGVDNHGRSGIKSRLAHVLSRRERFGANPLASQCALRPTRETDAVRCGRSCQKFGGVSKVVNVFRQMSELVKLTTSDSIV